MIHIIQQIIFLVLLAGSFYIIRKRFLILKRNINFGKDVQISGDRSARLRNMLLVAFGQKKMFKRPLPAVLHLFVYVGFLVINIEVLEFLIDGFTGWHRTFAPYLGEFYTVLMNIFEFLAVSVVITCAIFLVRRNVLKVPRFWYAEMERWPRLDANVILWTEIVLMLAILTMNATDQVLQVRDPAHYPATGSIFFSGFLKPAFEGLSTPVLIGIERFAWWFHIIGIFAFTMYITTYSKHLHIFTSFPNTYFAKLGPKGHMNNMPVVTNEVKSMLGIGDATTPPAAEPGRFGAKDINDLSWTSLLGAYSCTECGRCTAECPANMTGKKLSPRKIMMDTRDRMEEVERSLKVGGPGLEDGKSLLNDYITKEEINACTNCQACVEACPVQINPLEIIVELRRYVAMEESGSPASWNAMFQNIETNFAPWKFAPSDRFNWAKEMNAK